MIIVCIHHKAQNIQDVVMNTHVAHKTFVREVFRLSQMIKYHGFRLSFRSVVQVVYDMLFPRVIVQVKYSHWQEQEMDNTHTSLFSVVFLLRLPLSNRSNSALANFKVLNVFSPLQRTLPG